MHKEDPEHTIERWAHETYLRQHPLSDWQFFIQWHSSALALGFPGHCGGACAMARRRFTPSEAAKRFASSVIALAKPANGCKRTRADDKFRKR